MPKVLRFTCIFQLHIAADGKRSLKSLNDELRGISIGRSRGWRIFRRHESHFINVGPASCRRRCVDLYGDSVKLYLEVEASDIVIYVGDSEGDWNR